jgi:succinate-semialdehyde dehydrogenase/glutarate-semialdehyde dehydrogenase
VLETVRITAVNPSTDLAIGSYEPMRPGAVADTIRAAHEASREWRSKSFRARAYLMRELSGLLRNRTEEFARLMALEMGKPVAQGRQEIEKCAWTCLYFADWARRMLSPVNVRMDGRRSFITFQPLGLILAIMPWNFPFWQVFRFAVPALMAGNGVVLKHASNVPGCALAIERLFADAGFPAELVRTLLIDSEAALGVIENPLVRAVTLTGSTAAGKAVAAKAGSLVKKTVLELGGSDPYVVLEDADLALAARTCAAARLVNSGQSCIAAKRFIVVESRFQEFGDLLVEEFRKRRVGDPLDPETQIGPLARRNLREALDRQVKDSLSQGARLLVGGSVPEGPGAYYPPTILASVSRGMPAYHEELFGPVAALLSARDEADAVRLANDTSFGLGAAVFSSNLDRAERIAATELDCGVCFVNSQVASDPRLPFGGVKDSGYGRELSQFGIREFVNVKSVVMP